MDYLNYLFQLLDSIVAGISTTDYGTLIMTSGGYLAIAAGAFMLITNSLKKTATSAILLGVLSVLASGETLSVASVMEAISEMVTQLFGTL
jgi:hypothetical protein